MFLGSLIHAGHLCTVEISHSLSAGRGLLFHCVRGAHPALLDHLWTLRSRPTRGLILPEALSLAGATVGAARGLRQLQLLVALVDEHNSD